jgi:hypothetical protein
VMHAGIPVGEPVQTADIEIFLVKSHRFVPGKRRRTLW